MVLIWLNEKIQIKDLKEFSDNPRKISKKDFDRLVNDIKQDGYHRRIMLSHDNHIIGGHSRKKALLKAGYKLSDEIEVIKPSRELTETEFKRLNVRDNLYFGEFDTDLLANHFESTQLIEWGMPPEWLPEEPEVQVFEGEDEVQEVNTTKEPTTKLGDVWILGNHRLMCGCSTSITDMDVLLQKNKVDATFTSPPYNVGCFGYDGGKDKYKGESDNKDQDEYFQFLMSFTNICLLKSSYIFFNNQFLSNNRHALARFIGHYHAQLKEVFPWIKSTAPPNINKGIFTNRFEFFLCLESESTKKAFPVDWQGKYNNVIEGNTAASENVTEGTHSATMPLYVPLWFIERLPFIKTILDPFGGSGTTLIACEKTNRQCYMMELSPHYCDTIIARWEKLTGKTAKLEIGG